MQAQDVAIKPNVKVIMKSDTEMLDEVMVIAYGTTKKESFTGSAEVIKSEKLKERPVANVTKALDGMVAGVQTTSWLWLYQFITITVVCSGWCSL